ncbi:hypothetical protein Lal_00049373 [Lupinus albus]|nr:hypothetical protein Lal_00049373 [Lupinus albus]
MLNPIEGEVFEPPYPKWYDPAASCAYHYNTAGHSIEKCRDLKYKPCQDSSLKDLVEDSICLRSSKDQGDLKKQSTQQQLCQPKTEKDIEIKSCEGAEGKF